LKNDDVYVILTLKNGSKRKVEAQHGTSFLSQSSRFLLADDMVKEIQIVNRSGEKRSVQKEHL
jgi:hypothetical protein